VNVAPIYSPAILSALLIFAWTYALYEASRSRTSSASPRNGRKLFAVTACGFLFVLPLAHIVYVWDGDPPGAALAALGLALLPTVMGLFVVFWLASEALSTFEARVAAPGSSQPDHPFLAILFIGIGVWFLRGRIERMLDHALAEVVT
jgi:drug/metabolite transporter (DMT)-like permease